MDFSPTKHKQVHNAAKKYNPSLPNKTVAKGKTCEKHYKKAKINQNFSISSLCFCC